MNIDDRQAINRELHRQLGAANFVWWRIYRDRQRANNQHNNSTPSDCILYWINQGLAHYDNNGNLIWHWHEVDFTPRQLPRRVRDKYSATQRNRELILEHFPELESIIDDITQLAQNHTWKYHVTPQGEPRQWRKTKWRRASLRRNDPQLQRQKSARQRRKAKAENSNNM